MNQDIGKFSLCSSDILGRIVHGVLLVMLLQFNNKQDKLYNSTISVISQDLEVRLRFGQNDIG